MVLRRNPVANLPDLEKKVLDWMFNKLKGKYSVIGPGEEPEEEEAADEAEAAADDTETPPRKGQTNRSNSTKVLSFHRAGVHGLC
jgi:hypothetical protein